MNIFKSIPNSRTTPIPGEDEPKPPLPPGSAGPEPDVPDTDDDLRELVRPVKT